MGDKTGISWTDHTFNPWWGCTAIAPGCDNCYAAALDKRTGGDYWNPKNNPRLTSKGNWAKPLHWNAQAIKEGRRHRVFCGSMMDWCDKNAPTNARFQLFNLIQRTPMLDWQLLTKRATLIEKCLPDDWGDGYKNVWLGVTVENREYGFPRVDALKDIPAKVRFLSIEPLLEDLGPMNLSGIDWVIVGGESGPGFRKMAESWALNAINQAIEQNVPAWFKQWGGNTKDKGGSIIGSSEIKQWPVCAA